jgi:PST family polysaccharide transporter
VIALPAFAQVPDAERRNLGLVRCSGPTFAVAVLAGMTLSTLAVPVVTILYGERWQPAAAALAGLAVFGGLRVVFDLFATFLIAVGQTRQVLVVQLVWLAVMVPVMYLGVRAFGLVGAGWSHVAVAVLVVLPLYGTYLRRVGVDIVALLRGAVVPLAAAVPAAALCAWLGQREGRPWLFLAGGVLVALFAYALPLSRWWLASVDLVRRPLASN